MTPDDLCFLLCSPLYLYGISTQLKRASSHSLPALPAPKSMTANESAHAFDIMSLDIRIKWEKNSWVSQLTYGDTVLLEGRQLHVRQDIGFAQSFFWFCEEARSLPCEYKAREHALAVKTGRAVDVELLRQKDEGDGLKALRSSKGREGRRSLKLKIRLRDTRKGRAGVYRLE
jgi:hypothetical protein